MARDGPPAEDPHLIGTVFGHYRVTRKLGQGGVGDVWKAIDLSLDREVALKVLRPDLAAQPELVARFRAEALALAKLNHPHIAAIYGFHVEDACPFMVMECVQGQTLDAVVRASGRMELARALPLFYQVLDAIQHAHDQGIVHRDLKASNVMLSQLGVKVLDFGIARQVGSVHLTRGTHGVGTPSWMAPEQIRAEEADARTDVYALGLLLYWLVAARLPFEGDNEFAVQRAHLEQEAASPRVHAPDLPGAVEKAILRALAKDRAQRFASVAELRRELGERREPTRMRVLPLDVALDALPALEADDECTLVTGAVGGAPPTATSADVPTRILAESSDEEREAVDDGANGAGERREAAAAPVHGAGRDVAPAPRGRAGTLPLAWAAAAFLAACAMLGIWASAPREQLDRPSAQRPPPAGAPGSSTAPGSATTPGSATAMGSALAPEAIAPAAQAPATPVAHDAAAMSARVAAHPAARKQRSAHARSEDRWVIRRD